MVAGGDATPIFEATEAALDDVAALICFLVVSNALLAVGFTGDYGLVPTFFEPGTKRIGVIPFVRQQFSDAWDQARTCFSHGAVGGVAGREHERPRPAFFV